MSKKKNIDHFFQEHLEHLEVTPPKMAWENIEAKLNEKEKKRRVIPFWWKLSGIAAVLFIGFGLITPFIDNNPNPQKTIVNQQNGASKDTNTNKSNQLNTAPTQEGVVSEGDIKKKGNTSEVKSSEAIIEKNTLAPSLTDKNQQQKTSIVSVSKNKNKESNSNKKRQSANQVLPKTNGSIAANSANSTLNKKGTTSTKVKKSNSTIVSSSNDAIANPSSVKTNKVDTPLEIPNPNSDKNANQTLERKSELVLLENTDEKIDEIKKIDSTKLANVEPNALEELLNEKEKKIAKEPKLNRWQVTPNIAPIYFSSMSNGSPLDEKLVSNEKVYGTNYSYGLGVNYAVNKKLQIRSGVHTFSADYDTKGIVFYQNTNASRMQNVTPNLQGSLIQIDPLSNVTTSFGRIIEDKFEGTLNQRMSYIEVPFEASYKILSKKFGIDLIGGMSTLFLNENDVYLKTPGFTMKIGEANNLNKVHFSTNIGLGLKYSFLKRFDARIEPLFKYQINTYSSGAGDFKPYVFGVYSGISYQF